MLRVNRRLTIRSQKQSPQIFQITPKKTDQLGSTTSVLGVASVRFPIAIPDDSAVVPLQ
jgi:hypothetical protein